MENFVNNLEHLTIELRSFDNEVTKESKYIPNKVCLCIRMIDGKNVELYEKLYNTFVLLQDNYTSIIYDEPYDIPKLVKDEIKYDLDRAFHVRQIERGLEQIQELEQKGFKFDTNLPKLDINVTRVNSEKCVAGCELEIYMTRESGIYEELYILGIFDKYYFTNCRLGIKKHNKLIKNTKIFCGHVRCKNRCGDRSSDHSKKSKDLFRTTECTDAVVCTSSSFNHVCYFKCYKKGCNEHKSEYVYNKGDECKRTWCPSSPTGATGITGATCGTGPSVVTGIDVERCVYPEGSQGPVGKTCWPCPCGPTKCVIKSQYFGMHSEGYKCSNLEGLRGEPGKEGIQGASGPKGYDGKFCQECKDWAERGAIDRKCDCGKPYTRNETIDYELRRIPNAVGVETNAKLCRDVDIYGEGYWGQPRKYIGYGAYQHNYIDISKIKVCRLRNCTNHSDECYIHRPGCLELPRAIISGFYKDIECLDRFCTSNHSSSNLPHINCNSEYCLDRKLIVKNFDYDCGKKIESMYNSSRFCLKCSEWKLGGAIGKRECECESEYPKHSNDKRFKELVVDGVHFVLESTLYGFGFWGKTSRKSKYLICEMSPKESYEFHLEPAGNLCRVMSCQNHRDGCFIKRPGCLNCKFTAKTDSTEKFCYDRLCKYHQLGDNSATKDCDVQYCWLESEVPTNYDYHLGQKIDLEDSIKFIPDKKERIKVMKLICDKYSENIK